MTWKIFTATHDVSIFKVLSLVIVAVTRFGGGDFHDSQIFVPPAPKVKSIFTSSYEYNCEFWCIFKYIGDV